MAQRSRQMSGSSVSSLINPVNGYRDTLRRKGIEPRNHAKENIANLRRKQQVNREQKEDEASRGDGKFVMKRFRDVESRVEVGAFGRCRTPLLSPFPHTSVVSQETAPLI